MPHLNQNLTIESPFGGAQAYHAKSVEYFTGARYDYIDELPVNREARIFEVGCGYGETGSLALARHKCGTYCGVELCLTAAEEAKGRLSEVVVGNIEEVQLPWPTGSFDVLILSEVLEHLVDPWNTLRKIRRLMKSGSQILASSPNVSHYKFVKMLLQGDWTLTDVGPMDKTHLRWFTPKTYRDLFESSGYIVDSVRALEPFGNKARLANTLTFARFEHLFVRQIDLRAHCE